MSTFRADTKNVVIIGAGVAGLTTGIVILEKGGYDVTIVAETFPGDPKTIKYCSNWAGGHHVSHASGDARIQKIDADTLKVMWELSAPGGDAEGCFLRIHETEFFYDGRDVHLDWMPDFKRLPDDALPGAQVGISFTTVTFDSPKYVAYLLARFLARGGTIVRGAVQHVSQLVEGGPDVFALGRAAARPVDALVVCAGLGARTLGGVDDQAMYPVRGQTILLRAPWVTSGRTASHEAQGLWTYIIPRRCGNAVCGGTKLENDWYPAPRPEMTEDILTRCLALCPDLAPPEIRALRTPTIEDLRPLIVEEGVGQRPARKGGLRLDIEMIEGRKGQGQIPMVFNYGHSGSGFQSSWGSASVALQLLENALSDTKES